MFSIDTKSIGIALALALLLGALGACSWYLKRLLVERETCKAAIEAQNAAILEQNLATETYIENLQAAKEAIESKYRHRPTHHNPTAPKSNPTAKACVQMQQELSQIAQDLQTFKAETRGVSLTRGR
ncbi:hypothetical protein NHP190003_13470 [Helicobacter sp. NHP19-003]|uniref:DUF2570 domain-containing protein n=1 Tax=Helicobacter gastrocanis TaxID=2849641 RepID=A0ABN6I396_9HELI|nr:hypothetical protein [Helicobacter sp. NHP19-003]BCZ18065.1 hypothetical protein NHP190003_13470 [Helicobacter sp. NHP19-003]